MKPNGVTLEAEAYIEGIGLATAGDTIRTEKGYLGIEGFAESIMDEHILLVLADGSETLVAGTIV